MRLQNLGGIRLFKVFGITVYLNATWFLAAAYFIFIGKEKYHHQVWAVAECLSLFAIVLLHEFGHALACRSVGGRAERIVLWPLGGVAFVDPPPRPGAMLWSLAAGPLVNVALLPLTIPFFFFSPGSDFHLFLYTLASINLAILVFNMLPIYPLDGGQILQSILWFFIGRRRSLLVAASIGMVGTLGLAGLAIFSQNYLLGAIAIFAAMQCWSGVKLAHELGRREIAPRRQDLACPICHAPPAIGPLWICSTCQTRFDAFDHRTQCPGCGKIHEWTTCLNCGARTPFAAWELAPASFSTTG